MVLLVKKFEATGEKPGWLSLSGDGLDDLNERQVAERRDLDPSLIWTHFRDTHQVLVEFLETCDEHVFVEGTFTGDSINAETWKHYQGLLGVSDCWTVTEQRVMVARPVV